MTAYQIFLSKLTRGLSDYYGEGYRVDTVRTRKNNGVEFQGIAIMKSGSDISPTIYMEHMFRDYVNGEPLSEIMKRVMEIYENHQIDGAFDTGFFRDFETARNSIVYRLVGHEANRSFLDETPHMDFLDMALVFYVVFFHDRLGSASIPVGKEICHMWGIGEDELAAPALKNTPRLLPFCLTDIRQALENAPGMSYEEGERAYMYILTNENRQYGAGCMLYPQVLGDFARRTGEDFYVLPSSVHEVLLVPGQQGVNGRELLAMVREINRTQVEPEEVLTDSVYYYDRIKEKILILDISDKL